jgi:NAD(P)H dehydrogenase (quinone)
MGTPKHLEDPTHCSAPPNYTCGLCVIVLPGMPSHSEGTLQDMAMTKNVRDIVITGATGGLGSAVVEQLLHLVHPSKLAISVREPQKAARFEKIGIRVRQANFMDPASLDQTFSQVKRVLLISTRTPSNSERFREQKNAIDAAVRCGVKHVFYTSIVQRPGSVFDVAAGHHQTEKYLAAAPVDHTILRNGQYIENLPMFLGRSISTGDLALPADGPTAWVSRVDLAEGIARLLLLPRSIPASVLLTGPEAIDFEAIASIAGKAVGRPIKRRVVEATEFIDMLCKGGVPPQAAHTFASGFASRAAGELDILDPALRNLLGRELLKVSDVLPQMLAASATTAPKAPQAASLTDR